MNPTQPAASGKVPNSNRRDRWLAAGGVVGAVLASTCCIVPLLLVTIGVSGAWIGNLTALEPYSIYFMIAAVAFVGLGFWHVYFRRSPDCVDGSYCAQPQSRRTTKIALWAAALLLLLNATMGWWAPLFY
ncbi:MAG TPA: mercuric transporter MerT family protein [Allosphingosinicella sp.]|nr:mercuric transporter MerT family protein [Allosphingosinicella sp.]